MAFRETIRARWFWYSVFCLLCWGPWALLSKLGSREIPAAGMQFLFTLGGVPAAVAVLTGMRFKMEKSARGITYGLIVGVLSAVGSLALFAAYRTGGNTAVITTVTSLYPIVTVGLAVVLLRERLTWVQVAGLAFAAAAFIIFSLSV